MKATSNENLDRLASVIVWALRTSDFWCNLNSVALFAKNYQAISAQYDKYTATFKQKPHDLLDCFDVLSNLKKPRKEPLPPPTQDEIDELDRAFETDDADLAALEAMPTSFEVEVHHHDSDLADDLAALENMSQSFYPDEL